MSRDDPTDLELQRVRQIRRFRGTLTIAEMGREMGIGAHLVRRIVHEFGLPYYGDTPGEQPAPGHNQVRLQALTEAAWRREIDAAKAEAVTARPYKSGPLEW